MTKHNSEKKEKSSEDLIREFLETGGQAQKLPPDPKLEKYYQMNSREFIDDWYAQDRANREYSQNKLSPSVNSSNEEETGLYSEEEDQQLVDE